MNVPPPPQSGNKSIVHVDNFRISNRYKDETTVESIHRKVLDENPRAFHRVAAFGEEYIKAGVKYRHMTPVYPSHQRLTSLEDALKNMTIAQYSNSTGNGHTSRPHTTSSIAAELIATRTGRLTPSLVPHNVPRLSLSRGSTSKFPPQPFQGDPTASHHAISRAYATQTELRTIDPLQETSLHSRGIPSRGSIGTASTRRTSTPATAATRRSSDFRTTTPYAMEQHAKYTSRALQWKPVALDAEFAREYMEAAAQAVEASIPEPLPLLQTQATPFQYISRTSSSGATQKNYVSKLNQSLYMATQNRLSGAIHMPVDNDAMTNSQFLGYSTISKPLFMDSGSLEYPVPLRTASQGTTRPLKMGTIRCGTSSRYSAKIQPLTATNRLRDPSSIQQLHSEDYQDYDQDGQIDHDNTAGGGYGLQSPSPTHSQDGFHARDFNSSWNSVGSASSHSHHNQPSIPSRPDSGLGYASGGDALHAGHPSPYNSSSPPYVHWMTDTGGGDTNHAHSPQRVGTSDQLPNRVSRSAGGFRTLSRMDTGNEVVTKGLLQARTIRRMAPNHNVDLAVGYIDKGLWPVLNLKGDTRNANTRTLKPQPEVGKSSPIQNDAAYEEYPYYNPEDTAASESGTYMLQKPDSTHKGMYASYSDHALSVTNGSQGQYFNENTLQEGWGEHPNLTRDGVSRDSTALGNVLKERAENTDNPQYDSLRRMSSTVPNRKGKQSSTNPELAELDKFERVNDLNNPSHWTKKAIRSKIIASGVLKELGLTPETLAKASKEMLLAAYQRIPSTKRMMELYSAEKPMSRSLSRGTTLSF